MNTLAVCAENLSKRYRLGTSRHQHDTLRDQAAYLLRRLTRHGRGAEEINRTIWALRDVSLEIQWGEVVGIIGHNGAGKTTLLKILSRITEPTRGCAQVYGRVGSLLEVGTGFHPELTGRENIFLNGAILGMNRSEIKAKFVDIVSFAQVERFIDTPVKRYSTGMYVRLGFSVAAHLEPDILIVDEVLSVGDAAFQKKCLGKMTEVATSGRAVLFTSHNMPALVNLCTRAYRLDHGIIVDTGPPVDVVQRYLVEGEPASYQDLSKHPRRRAGYRALMRSIRLFQDSEATSTFTTGGSFGFEVEYAVDPDVAHDVDLAFQIRDRSGVNIAGSHADEYGRTQFNTGGVMATSAVIDHLMLSPGTYTLTLFLDSGSSTLDVIDDAVSFEVLWTPRNDLIHPRNHWPLTFMPTRWESRTMRDSLEHRDREVTR
jgi:lipopolysaccharide transport system ATP-binding protein